MLALLTLAYGEYIMSKLGVLKGLGGSRKGEMCSQFKTMLACFLDDNGIIDSRQKVLH
jgi:hypothetical protein